MADIESMITIDANKIGNKGSFLVTTLLDDKVMHIDEIELAKAAERDRYVRAVRYDCPEINDEVVREMLLEYAAEQRPGDKDASEDDTPREWAPLRLGQAPEVERFPLEVLPEPMARLATEVGRATGCDPGVPATAMLAIAGGLIGRSATLEVEPDWFASASIYAATVVEPGRATSAALGYVAEPIRRAEEDLVAVFECEKDRYQMKLTDYKVRMRDPNERLTADKPERPVRARTLIEHTSMEALLGMMAEPLNVRGLMIMNDQLGMLWNGLNPYKKGRGYEQPKLRRIWAGEPVELDRARDEFGEPVCIPEPALSIVGNIPPAMTRETTKRRGDDGFRDCWLMYYPDRMPRPKSSERQGVSDEAMEGWTRIARRLSGRYMREAGKRPYPRLVSFDESGKAAFDAGLDRHVDSLNGEEIGEELLGAWSNMEVYAARLALTLALLHHAAAHSGQSAVGSGQWGEGRNAAPADPVAVPEVTAEMAEGAWRLIDCFKSHARRVRQIPAKGHGMPEGARLTLNWIRNHPEAERVSQRDLTQCYPPRQGYSPGLLADGAEWLVLQQALRADHSRSREPGKAGRPAGPAWEISPELRRADGPWSVVRGQLSVARGATLGSARPAGANWEIDRDMRAHQQNPTISGESNATGEVGPPTGLGSLATSATFGRTATGGEAGPRTGENWETSRDVGVRQQNPTISGESNATGEARPTTRLGSLATSATFGPTAIGGEAGPTSGENWATSRDVGAGQQNPKILGGRAEETKDEG